MKKIKKYLLGNPKVFSHVNSSVDFNISDEINEEAKMNVLEQMLKLFLWVSSLYSNCFNQKQKHYSNIQNNKGLIEGVKNLTSKLFINE